MPKLGYERRCSENRRGLPTRLIFLVILSHVFVPMSAFGTKQTSFDGQSMSALPGYSDINLFSYRQGIIDLDTEVMKGALDLCMAE